VVLDAASLPRRVKNHEVELALTGDNLPALRLLEADVPCALRLRLASLRALRALVVRARAVADFGYRKPIGRLFRQRCAPLGGALRAHHERPAGRRHDAAGPPLQKQPP